MLGTARTITHPARSKRGAFGYRGNVSLPPLSNHIKNVVAFEEYRILSEMKSLLGGNHTVKGVGCEQTLKLLLEELPVDKLASILSESCKYKYAYQFLTENEVDGVFQHLSLEKSAALLNCGNEGLSAFFQRKAVSGIIFDDIFKILRFGIKRYENYNDISRLLTRIFSLAFTADRPKPTRNKLVDFFKGLYNITTDNSIAFVILEGCPQLIRYLDDGLLTQLWDRKYKFLDTMAMKDPAEAVSALKRFVTVFKGYPKKYIELIDYIGMKILKVELQEELFKSIEQQIYSLVVKGADNIQLVSLFTVKMKISCIRDSRVKSSGTKRTTTGHGSRERTEHNREEKTKQARAIEVLANWNIYSNMEKEEAKRCYNELALQMHPDRNGNIPVDKQLKLAEELAILNMAWKEAEGVFSSNP